MARKKGADSVELGFGFYYYLHQFYQQNKGAIRQHYRELSRKFLDFNNPDNADAFLRRPQFEALEIYIFLKEFLDNKPVHNIFEDWYKRRGKFTKRQQIGLRTDEVQDLFDKFEEDDYEKVFKRLKKQARIYPNYIFALTMGTGKTILMATSIFYEFILSNKFPKDSKYCHNALVFAPDKTVLQSLKEIQTFDMRKVVPPEYVNFLTTHIQYHFLDQAGTTLSTLENSRFNLIISNTQKIILKKQHAERTGTEKLFGSEKPKVEANSIYEQYQDLYDSDEPEDEAQLVTNQRFEKIRRLDQLGIYIDEAHHAFGTKLAKDMGVKQTKTSLRTTVDLLAKSLEVSGTQVVACYNYTGTPYVGSSVLPEVVYAYGLQDAIDNKYLKQVSVNGYTSTKDKEFVALAIKDFLDHTDGKCPEGIRPKLALFAATIDELEHKLKPAVEEVLDSHGISSSEILVNVGDAKLTTNDDIREFNRLDTPQSEKRFILLVNKGREGWNCRSLFGVGLFREPKSKIFVLQATMRCLRSIGDVQYTGRIYLGESNLDILNKELQQNFRIDIEDFQNAGQKKKHLEVHVVMPPRKIKLQRVRRYFNIEEKSIDPRMELGLKNVDFDKYKTLHIRQDGLDSKSEALQKTEEVSYIGEQRIFSELTMVAEIARYLNKPCVFIRHLLASTKEGIQGILEAINAYNEILYDEVIPRLFNALYKITPEERKEEYEVELVKIPEKGYYEVSADADKVVTMEDPQVQQHQGKSFHLDTYCFDSNPEKNLFWRLLGEKRVKKIYFTGMLTHGQTEFFVQYIDPDSHTIRSYYPDFLFQRDDGTYVIVEVKGEHQLDDPVVKAKQDFAEQLASASGMVYRIIGSKQVNGDEYEDLMA